MLALPEPPKEASQVREEGGGEGVRIVCMGGQEAFLWSPEI